MSRTVLGQVPSKSMSSLELSYDYGRARKSPAGIPQRYLGQVTPPAAPQHFLRSPSQLHRDPFVQALPQGQERPSEHKRMSLPQEASGLNLSLGGSTPSLPVVTGVQCWCLSMRTKERPYLGKSGDAAGHNLLLLNVLKVRRSRKPNSNLSQSNGDSSAHTVEV